MSIFQNLFCFVLFFHFHFGSIFFLPHKIHVQVFAQMLMYQASLLWPPYLNWHYLSPQKMLSLLLDVLFSIALTTIWPRTYFSFLFWLVSVFPTEGNDLSRIVVVRGGGGLFTEVSQNSAGHMVGVHMALKWICTFINKWKTLFALRLIVKTFPKTALRNYRTFVIWLKGL